MTIDTNTGNKIRITDNSPREKDYLMIDDYQSTTRPLTEEDIQNLLDSIYPDKEQS
mgnify:CR=1 FL=1